MSDFIREIFGLGHLTEHRYRTARFCERYDQWKSCCYDEGRFEGQIVPIIRPTGTCVELGAGTGFLTRILAKHCDQVFAFDRAAAMIEYAKRTFESEGIHNVRFGVAEHVFVPKIVSADIVVAGWSLLSGVVLELEWRAVLQEVIDHAIHLLRPGGTIAVLETANMFRELPLEGVYHPRRKALLGCLKDDFGFEPHFVANRWRFRSVRQKKRSLLFWGGRALARQAKRCDGPCVDESVAVFTRQV